MGGPLARAGARARGRSTRCTGSGTTWSCGCRATGPSRGEGSTTSWTGCHGSLRCCRSQFPCRWRAGTPAAGYPLEWAVYEWLPGENPAPGAVPDSVAGVLASFVRALHAADLPAGPASARGSDLSSFDEFTRANLEALRGELDTAAAEALWEEALAVPEWPHAPVWRHGDLMPGNLLVEDGRLTGVIDWECVGMGDPACDLMVAWNVLPASGRQIFRELLDVDDDTWARGRGWALWTGLGGVPYYRETFPEFAANARRTVDEILREAA